MSSTYSCSMPYDDRNASVAANIPEFVAAALPDGKCRPATLLSAPPTVPRNSRTLPALFLASVTALSYVVHIPFQSHTQCHRHLSSTHLIYTVFFSGQLAAFIETRCTPASRSEPLDSLSAHPARLTRASYEQAGPLVPEFHPFPGHSTPKLPTRSRSCIIYASRCDRRPHLGGGRWRPAET